MCHVTGRWSDWRGGGGSLSLGQGQRHKGASVDEATGGLLAITCLPTSSLYSLVPVYVLYDVHVRRLYAAAYICYVTIMLTACCVRTVAASGGFRVVFTLYCAVETVVMCVL